MWALLLSVFPKILPLLSENKLPIALLLALAVSGFLVWHKDNEITGLEEQIATYRSNEEAFTTVIDARNNSIIQLQTLINNNNQNYKDALTKLQEQNDIVKTAVSVPRTEVKVVDNTTSKKITDYYNNIWSELNGPKRTDKR